MLHEGLYEQFINKKLNRQIKSEVDKLATFAPIDNEEAPKILSKYLAEIIEKELLGIKSNDINTQIEYVNKIVELLGNDDANVDARAEQLFALISRQNNIHALYKTAEIARPVTSLAQSSIFTGAVHEPSMFTELKKEILSCDRIDMLVSFIKWSGLRLIMEELSHFTQNGGKLRIITTSYMGATDVKAIEELRGLSNTEIKISYDTKRTRLHAKAYVFYRDTGFTTAYVGSSNLSFATLFYVCCIDLLT